MNTKFNYPLVVVGAQWGDEGKGKIVDLLAEDADVIARFNGGNNAGHSVVVDGEKFKLSLIPSGVLQKKKLVLSQGVVIDPKILLDEISFFEKRGIKVNLSLDPRIQIVMPYHKELDAATEAWKGKNKTGSLKLGIGYSYEDKNNRFGVRLEDLIDSKRLKEKIETLLPMKIKQITKVFEQKTNLKSSEIFKTYNEYGKKLKKYVTDTSILIQNAVNKNEKVLFEGAHGTFLDAVFGTYPYTVAIHTISGSVFPYVGLAPQKIYTLGIVKAYTTRVGNGPFPTELFDKTGAYIQEKGAEFGSVSKRPRRCGWLDLPMLRTATRLSGFNFLAITKLDVLTGLKKLKICTHYTLNNKKILEIPATMTEFDKCKPVFKDFDGWTEDISQIRNFDLLPKNAKTYINYMSKSLNVSVKIISLSPDRKDNIIL